MSLYNTKIYASTLSELLGNFQNEAQGSQTIESFVEAIVNVALPLSGICVFLLLSFSAFKIMTSQGNPDRLKDAKDQITNAIIGFVFIVLSIVILIFISELLGINIEQGY